MQPRKEETGIEKRPERARGNEMKVASMRVAGYRMSRP